MCAVLTRYYYYFRLNSFQGVGNRINFAHHVQTLYSFVPVRVRHLIECYLEEKINVFTQYIIIYKDNFPRREKKNPRDS